MIHDTAVVETASLGAYRVLTVRAPGLASSIRPGQFINVAIDQGAGTLRRPFSVYLADPEAETVSIAFDEIGAGTAWIASRVPGDVLSVVGPLGHGFDLPTEPGADIIVGGGYGAAALSSLSAALDDIGGVVHGVLGGRSADRIFHDEVLTAHCASLAIMTDDGSAGARGIVSDPLPDLIARFSPRTVFACGPMRMLESVSGVCAATGVTAQLAVEEFMACGIGVCWTCAIPVNGPQGMDHQRSCIEGPVFEGAVVAWA